MPRAKRLKSATGLYHITDRGLNKEIIYPTAHDMRKMIEFTKEHAADYSVEFYAYCIMSNHFHFLLKVPFTQLLPFMQTITSTYATYYNSRYTRVGHVFQGRFHSECVENEPYYWCCVRYIHNNPLHAHMVNAPQRYTFSSIQEYMKPGDGLLHPHALKMYHNHYSSPDNFLLFHSQSDRHLFLDTPEEMQLQKRRLVKAYLKEFLAEHPLLSEESILNSAKLKSSFIKEASEKLAISMSAVKKIIDG